MESIACKWLQRRGASPQVVMNAFRHRLDGRVADRFPPLVTESASHVDIANQPRPHLIHCFPYRGARTALATVLANDIVLLDSTHQLPAFPPVMGTGLLNVDMFARLGGPDPYQ